MTTPSDTTEKPTLETLGLECSISANGVKSIGQWFGCAWLATFTNKKTGRTETFDYHTGPACGPKGCDAQLESWLRQFYPTVAYVPKHNRYTISDKPLLCRVAHAWAHRMKWTPDPIEIMNAIAREGDALELTFEDWAKENYYGSDSWEAEKTYQSCRDGVLRLRRILSAKTVKEIAQLDI